LGRRTTPLKKVWFKNGLAEGSTRATTHEQPSR
jgi:hypothetical protein